MSMYLSAWHLSATLSLTALCSVAVIHGRAFAADVPQALELASSSGGTPGAGARVDAPPTVGNMSASEYSGVAVDEPPFEASTPVSLDIDSAVESAPATAGRCGYLDEPASPHMLNLLSSVVYGDRDACLSDDPRERIFCGMLNSADFNERETADQGIRGTFSPLYLGELRQSYAEAGIANGNPTNLTDLVSRLRNIIRHFESTDDNCRIERFNEGGRCEVDFQSTFLAAANVIIQRDLTGPLKDTLRTGAPLPDTGLQSLESLVGSLYARCAQDKSFSIGFCWQRDEALTALFDTLVALIPTLSAVPLSAAEDSPFTHSPVDFEAKEQLRRVTYTDAQGSSVLELRLEIRDFLDRRVSSIEINWAGGARDNFLLLVGKCAHDGQLIAEPDTLSFSPGFVAQ